MNRRHNFIEDVHSIYTLKGSKAFQGFDLLFPQNVLDMRIIMPNRVALSPGLQRRLVQKC